MASTDSTRDSFRDRLLAILDYDEIPERSRVKHVAMTGKVSLSTARRMLTIYSDICKMSGHWLINLASGLNVNYCWLFNGKFERFDPRTMRIHLLKFENFEQVEMERIVSSLVLKPIEGEPMYQYLGAFGVDWSTAILFERFRRLNEWERKKELRFLFRLNNEDKKVIRLMSMLRAGQITQQYFYSMM